MAIYLLRSEASGLVKIGHAVNVAKRVCGLQIGSADALHLLRVLDGGLAEELVLHKRFAEYRKRGEWFALPADVVTGPMGLPDLPMPQQNIGQGRGGRPRVGAEVMTAAQRMARCSQRRRDKIAGLEAEVARLTAEVARLTDNTNT